MNDFVSLGVLPAFVERLAEKAVTVPTAVQAMTIPPLLEGLSIIFRSATGTGKTFAYLVPLLQKLFFAAEAARRGPLLLICAPTFELCSQIKTEAEFLLGAVSDSQYKPGIALLIGSVNSSRQIETLKKSRPHVIVGNPGRLLLLAKTGKLKWHDLEYIVLDEADRLAASECRADTEALVRLISSGVGAEKKPPIAVACSATVSEKTARYFSPLLQDARLLISEDHEILRDRIEHWAIFSESRRKAQSLISFLVAVKPKKALVFSSGLYETGKVASILQRRGISAAGLSGGMEKKDRKAAIDRFRSGKAVVLVCSDLAARGLDIPNITHIIALDISDNKENYIHRAGRTGRAGRRGIMVNIGDETEMRRLAVLEKKLGIVVHPKELYGGKVCAPEL